MLVRAERLAHPDLCGAELAGHLKDIAARARVPYDGTAIRKAIEAVEVATQRPRRVSRHREKPAVAPPSRRLGVAPWTEHCRHTPPCATQLQCEVFGGRR